MRKSDWIITFIGLIIIAIVAYLLYKKDVAREHLYQMYQHQHDLVKKVQPARESLSRGKKLVEEKKYVEAKASLEQTREEARKLIETLEQELADCQSDEEKGYFQPWEDEVKKIEEEASSVLASEDVRFGAEGLVKFEGKWVKPSRAKEIEEARFADEQQAKGNVSFEGKWMTPAERDQIKEKRAAEEQRLREEKIAAEQQKVAKAELAKGNVLYRGEWITPQEREKRIAEARRAAQQAAAGGGGGIRPMVQALAGALQQGAFTPDKSVWMIDDFERGIGGWQVEQWSDPSQVTAGTLDGSNALSIEYTGGRETKTALAHFMKPLDVSTRTKILMDVQNNGKRSVKLSLMLDADQAYETRMNMVSPGVHKDVAFDIKGPVFKCQSDGWQQYKFPLGKPEAVRRIMLMVNTPAQIIIDNIRMVAQ
jgi:hypothetical protein